MKCLNTNRTTRLKIVDHDSIGGEHVWVTSRLIFTSGKCGIWSLEAPKNHGFIKLRTSQWVKERPRHMMHIKTTYGGGRTFLSMLGKGNYFFVMSTISLKQRNFLSVDGDYIKDDHSFFPYGLMVRLGGEHSKWTWLLCSMDGWNMVVPFVFQHEVSNMDIGFHFLLMLCLWLLLLGIWWLIIVK